MTLFQKFMTSEGAEQEGSLLDFKDQLDLPVNDQLDQNLFTPHPIPDMEKHITHVEHRLERVPIDRHGCARMLLLYGASPNLRVDIDDTEYTECDGMTALATALGKGALANLQALSFGDFPGYCNIGDDGMKAFADALSKAALPRLQALPQQGAPQHRYLQQPWGHHLQPHRLRHHLCPRHRRNEQT